MDYRLYSLGKTALTIKKKVNKMCSPRHLVLCHKVWWE